MLVHYFKKFKIQEIHDEQGLPLWLSNKESACSAGDEGLIPGSKRSGGGHGNPLQYSCLEGHSPWGGKESDVTKHPCMMHKILTF